MFLAWLAALLVCLPMWIVIVEAVVAMITVRRAPGRTDGRPMPDTVVLIPAHNEASVIGCTLDSVAADLPANGRILCVAHNCSDGTADIARRHGAEVIEARDSGAGGKPDALKAGLRWLDSSPPEIVVIVDADCIVAKGAIWTLAMRARDLNRPVMGAYFFAAADSERGLSGLSSLAVMLKNFIRPLALHRLGLPCLINGSGSAYPFDVIRDAPHGGGSIAEDYQLTIDLLHMGYPTEFVPEARVDGQLPTPDRVALLQRKRWEHGHLYLTFHTAPRLLLEGLLRLDRNRIVLGLELAVPPLVFLGLMWVAAFGLALAWRFVQGGGPLELLVLTAASFTLAVLASWVRFAGAVLTISALAKIPAYLIWKLPMYREFITRRETRWVKTERD